MTINQINNSYNTAIREKRILRLFSNKPEVTEEEAMK